MIDYSMHKTAVAVANSRGQTLDEFAAEAFQAAIERITEMLIVVRDGLPCVQPLDETSHIDPAQVRRLVVAGVF